MGPEAVFIILVTDPSAFTISNSSGSCSESELPPIARLLSLFSVLVSSSSEPEDYMLIPSLYQLSLSYPKVFPNFYLFLYFNFGTSDPYPPRQEGNSDAISFSPSAQADMDSRISLALNT